MTNKIHIEPWCKVGSQTAVLRTQEWSVARLIELSKDLPVMEVPLNHLCVYYTYGNLSLREMVTHMKAVNDANLKYPIILDEDGELMDGRHRLMKAMLRGKSTIKVVRFPVNPSPCRTTEK